MLTSHCHQLKCVGSRADVSWDEAHPFCDAHFEVNVAYRLLKEQVKPLDENTD